MKSPNTLATDRNTTVSPQPRFNRLTLRRYIPFAALALLALLAMQTSLAQPSAAPPDPSVSDTSAFQPVIDGLTGKYGWLTTVLLAIGSLRILFKPVMLVVENALKNDPVKYAAIQKFEAGPIYKTIATILDVGASIKLPLIKR